MISFRFPIKLFGIDEGVCTLSGRSVESIFGPACGGWVEGEGVSGGGGINASGTEEDLSATDVLE
jgi:hypothetical protein